MLILILIFTLSLWMKSQRVTIPIEATEQRFHVVMLIVMLPKMVLNLTMKPHSNKSSM